MATIRYTSNNVLLYKDFSCKQFGMINEFKLPKTGTTGKIEILTPAHLPQVLALHEATRAALPEKQKMFVLPQAPDYFEKFLGQKAGQMIGISTNGQLVAQIIVMGPLTREDAVAKRAVTRNDIAYHHVGVMDTLVAIKSMAVHPEFRGNELSQHLVQAALELPLTHNVDHAFAQISVENTRSWELFLRNGFGIVAAAVDPTDSKPRFILQKPLGGFSFDMAPSADDVDPATDFPAIMLLTHREGLIGRIDDDATLLGELKLAFSGNAELEGALPIIEVGG